MFGFVTTINRKRGGGKAIRNAFLALRLVHVVGRPDMTAMIGLWLLDKDDLPLYYKGWSTITAADVKVSKKVYQEMADHELCVDTNWKSLEGFSTFEPSIKVLRGGSAQDSDPDSVVVSTILRKHAWRTTGWLRLEVCHRQQHAHPTEPCAHLGDSEARAARE